MKPCLRLHATRLALLPLIALASCAATAERAVPAMAPSRVVYLAHVSAGEAAQALDDSFAHGAGCDPARGGLRSGRLVVTPEPRGNALIIAAGSGHSAEVERALEFVRRFDVPVVASAQGS